MPSPEYPTEERAQLLSLARRSIENGLCHDRPLVVDPADYGPHLQGLRACFVTLHLAGELRGCTGTITPRSPLVASVCEHAFTSAFRDARFPPLRAAELEGLEISISVLSETEAIYFADESDLLAKIRPGIDGLILEERGCLATLLPSVWSSLPDPEHFLWQLKRKAGLPGDYWSPSIRVERYTTEEFS